ncbi:tail fiber assembly protein [Pantoea septica]|uniref:tail fiber assembly protein n=1 Tax=Pantoea septica TaxID=472695 RepID=UPI0028A1CD4F|nr:tail fiber assembly protein [Pantoea septica]
MKFSEKTQAFYANEIDYPNLPDDVIDIGDDYQELYSAINSSSHIYIQDQKVFVSDPIPDLYHTWDDTKKAWIITKEAENQRKADQISSAEMHQQQLIDSAMSSISVIQLKTQIGRTLTDTEKQKINSVLDFIDAVSALDVSAAPDIIWPEIE